jgi:hypothetical protein
MMGNTDQYNPRSDATKQRNEPGAGDDVSCIKCGAKALDTGLECDECGHDNYEAVTGKNCADVADDIAAEYGD